MDVNTAAKKEEGDQPLEEGEKPLLEAAQAPQMLHHEAVQVIECVEQWLLKYPEKIERCFVVHRPDSGKTTILDIGIVRTSRDQDQELSEAEKHLYKALQDSYPGVSVEIYSISPDENALAFVLHASCNSSVERVQELTYEPQQY